MKKIQVAIFSLFLLKIHSKYGGNCRLRSVTPLKGNGIKAAKNGNPNTLFEVPQTPMISEKAKMTVSKNPLEKNDLPL